MGELLAKAQVQLQTTVNERLDAVTQNLGVSMQTSTRHTAENLQKLNERLAVIDSAQKNLTDLSSQVTSLRDVLSNKQARGAFGQGRMEAIIQDWLPKGAYVFQYTLRNGKRPDCVVLLPDQRPLVIDAKFPLEAFTAFRDSRTDDERKFASQRVRQDVMKHVNDIAERYLCPGETQDVALMFVPSESIYAELHDGFDDVVQKAFRAQVMMVSPTLLMLAIQVIQQIQKDAQMREAADQIRDRGRSRDEGHQAARRARAQAANALRPDQRRHEFDPDLDRTDREARHAHRGTGIRRRGAPGEQRHPRAGPQGPGRRVLKGPVRPDRLPPTFLRHSGRRTAAIRNRRSLVRAFVCIPASLASLAPRNDGCEAPHSTPCANRPERQRMTATVPTQPASTTWREAFAVYLKPRVLIVLFLGFSAGLPLALSGSTLLVWMREVGVDLGTIGLFALVGTPYTIKFLWAPVVDALDVPVLSRLLGRRRGWLMISQILLMAAILILALSNPKFSPLIVVAGAALLVAVASATQDILIDAFRVESLDPKRAGRRHGVVRRGLSHRHAGLDRGRALRRQRLRDAGRRQGRSLVARLCRDGRDGR